MREMEELLAAKDRENAAKDEENRILKNQLKNVVSKEEVDNTIARINEAMQKEIEENKVKDQALEERNKTLVEKDKIIDNQARDKEFLEFKYSASQDTVKRQDKALADKDKMLESQNKVIDHLNDDKKHLHQEVEEWKISHEIKEKQLIELTEMLKYNDKDPSDKLSFMQDFLNNSFVKGIQTVSSHEYHPELSGESSFVKLEELSDH
jgi:chromosome segregation ATPase